MRFYIEGKWVRVGEWCMYEDKISMNYWGESNVVMLCFIWWIYV
jgi:hypothetical protein